jgi:hypothetical protein
MNAKQWRKAGYKTIFRMPLVFLYRPRVGLVFDTAVKNGEWMSHDDLSHEPWHCVEGGIDGLAPDVEADFRACAEHCYCDKGVDICDFCSGIRPAPEASPPSEGV